MTEEMLEFTNSPSLIAGRNESSASRFLFTGAAWPALAISTWFTLLALASPQLLAADNTKMDYQPKATYLCKIGNFVDWPTDGTSNDKDAFILGVLGDDALADVIERLCVNHTVQGRKLTVRRGKDPGEFKGCHMLFISGTEKVHLGPMLETFKGANLLTVGESENFCQSGGIINLKPGARNSGFEVNLLAAQRANLKISSQLLKLATITADAGKEEN